MSTTIYVSASQLHTWQACPRKWRFSRQWQADQMAGNLVFGTAIHEAINQYLQGVVWNKKTDPEAVLARRLRRLATPETTWSKGWDADVALAVGTGLLDQFTNWWTDHGLEVLIHKGDPMLEVAHRKRLDNDGIVLVGQADAIVLDSRNRIIVLDFKTAGSPTDRWFASVSYQLTAYQVLFEDLLGRPINRLGFLEMRKLKRKLSAPTLLDVPRHPESQVDNCLRQIRWMADDIRRGRFPAQTGMAFNSPCKLCDFRGLCHNGDKTGLKRRQRKLTFSTF